ncbi:glycosyltransferase [Leptothoe sp. PORK10 BA2]|uniref:glycosyltransferase n=1 Tax=Leptothoe sp. PORK10 BA2 TaxID=3110254 RepID=UPI002B216598|nr:glycosyltransferase [Leptothoe sp. PORK10 BA2]MEA5464688.1 glycosyltransferase [Leptothoe sp. PORK10 BA2]
MRFLFVGRFPEIGGSALATLPLIEALREAEHTVLLAHWVVPRRTDWFSQLDLCNLDLAQQGNLLSKIRCLTQLAIQCDIIIAVSELTPTYACQIAGWLTKKPVYAELQVHLDSWIKQNSSPLHHWLIRSLYPHLSGLRCVSKALLTYATKDLGIDKQKSFLVYNGFDLQQIQIQAQAALPQSMESWFTSTTVLCVGRLSQQKRFDLAILAFQQAQPKLPSDARLVIIGDGPLYTELQQLIAGLNLQNSVFLAGLQTNPFPFFANAALFLLSSDYEGFGRVLIEAMACGCPVIAHDCPVGPREVLEEGKSGLLVTDNQPTTLADAMILLLQNSSWRQQLIESGYLRCYDFEQTTLTQQHVQLLTQHSTH